MLSYSLNISRIVLSFFLLVSILSIFTLNTFLTIESIIALYLIYKLTWRRDEPPVIFFAFSFQLIQVISIVLISNFKNEPITYFTEFPHNISSAFQYSITSIVLMAFAFNIVTHKLPIKTNMKGLEAEIIRFDSDRIILWYFIITVSYFIEQLINKPNK